jgi:hypothetical protein
MSQFTIFIFGTGVFFVGALGLILIGLDAFRGWSDDDEQAGEGAFRAAEASRASERVRLAEDRPRGAGE